MDSIWQGFLEALRLLAAGDPEVYQVVLLSLQVSGVATAISVVMGVPLGLWLALHDFRGKPVVISFVNFGMGLPPVVVGLAIYLLLSRSGPLGALGWLFTPSAMVLAQIVIAFPVVAGLTEAAVQAVDPALRLQVRSLGATRLQETLAVLAEARLGLVAAILAAFGAIISEVGAVMMVGGNVAGRTRVFTTAIVLETRQGNFTLALALGGILLTITFLVNLVLLRLQGNIERH